MITTKKNFKTLRVGGYYRRQDGIIELILCGRDAEGYYRGQYTRYKDSGHHYAGPDANLDLIEEVTVTPVVPPKPRECWVALDANGIPGDAMKEPPCDAKGNVDTRGGIWVRMREVMDDEEGEE